MVHAGAGTISQLTYAQCEDRFPTRLGAAKMRLGKSSLRKHWGHPMPKICGPAFFWIAA